MNKIIIGIGFLAGIFFCSQAADIHARIKRDRIEVEKLKKDITRMKDSIGRMKGLLDVDLIALEQNTRRFYEAMDVVSHYRGIKSAVHIEGIDGQGAVAQAFKSSAWPGVMAADVKVTFSDIVGVDQNMAVLAFMRQMENKAPMRVKEIVYQGGRGLVLTVELYGRGI